MQLENHLHHAQCMHPVVYVLFYTVQGDILDVTQHDHMFSCVACSMPLCLIIVTTIMILCAGLNPTIASLSLGGSRDFLMKHKDDAKRKEKFPLENGDMLVMQGTTQSKWLHSIPERTSSVQPRVNITFRKAMNAAGTNNYYKYNVGDGGVYRMINGKMSQTA